ncbi:MAG TPA: hypothetical protein VFQ16_10880, partial [Burkholderiaceae bacterium]|nr:hypothetical protein [Burkholderiaceae bacterium]
MKVRDLDLSDHPVNAEHQALGLPPVEVAVTRRRDGDPGLRWTFWSVLLLLGGASLFLVGRLFNQPDGQSGLHLIDAALHSKEFWAAVAVGLVAQTVDGALGMAYGITSTSFLLATG